MDAAYTEMVPACLPPTAASTHLRELHAEQAAWLHGFSAGMHEGTLFHWYYVWCLMPRL